MNCLGLTKKGTPCKNPPKKGEQYCTIHSSAPKQTLIPVTRTVVVHAPAPERDPLKRVFAVRDHINQIEVMFLGSQIVNIQQGKPLSKGVDYLNEQLAKIIIHLNELMLEEK
jgi:hypothetical protein